MNLEALAQAASRYNRSKRSQSQSSSSSGYGSIISSSEKEVEEEKVEEEEESTSSKSKGKTKQTKQNEGEYKKLDMNNKGMLLLLKMGWTQGSGLGMMNDGRKDPIPTPAQTPLLGLGKSTQDQYMLSNAINKPKELESIVISKESQEDKIKREEKVKVLIEREEEREDRLKSFYCSICDKGYTNISQFEEHERSYAHHHARRALEAKQAKKSGNESIESRREKERKREEKELKRMAKAVGINVTVEPSSNPKPIQETQAGVKTQSGINKGGFKSMGFKPVSSSSVEVQPQKKMGFKPIGSSSSISSNANPTSSLISTPAPTFVISSTKSTGFQSTIEVKNSEVELSTTTIENKPNPGSKFAQIAARLAAKRLENGNGKSQLDTKKKVDSCNELERMLEDGTI
ncbi:uncharacterized protein MELLADRAFT_62380 [Melampsora larici-populina 98AG31]|uniref:G-patch domain-containing protein n=1 Tax=Melampsora larici-populina (strain 98AG31 / pathotype 3-4-7) TaxID=747676 RepID=F4RIS2_MELLP|nr:uncharacterized protein MELLADRAFT_62380 [Melampsora larici-populina 98AG31]EGG07611.1 hypothetical protein MELLADRAFT_62380 [Melampsora larici-populina 98AG31]